MSAPKLPLNVVPRAQRDVQSALLHSRRQWGREQRRRYRQVINRGFDTLRANPEIGRRREEHFPGCRTLPIGQHLIYYRVDATEIVVVRILHTHQDITSALFEPPPPESGR